MKKYTVLVAMLFYMTSAVVYAQSLGDLAKEEQKRREAVSGGTVVLEGARLAVSDETAAKAKAAGPKNPSPGAQSDPAIDAYLQWASAQDDKFIELLDLMNNMIEQNKEAQEVIKEMLAGLKEIIKDWSPEEKAVYKKLLEDQLKAQTSMMDIQFNKFLKEMSADEKKEYEKSMNDMKKWMEDNYKKTLKEVGLD